MSEWTSVSLRDATVSQDSRRVPVKKSDRVEGPYPYYGASGVVDYVNDFIFDGTFLLVAEDGDNLRTRNTPIAFLGYGRFWVNNHAHVLEAAPGFDIHFLHYAMQLVDVAGYLTGSTRPKLTARSLGHIEVQAPHLDEQRRIASVLGAFDDLIETNRDLASCAVHLARSIAAGVSTYVPLSEIATVSASRQIRPEGQVSHYSLPAFDSEQVPECVDGQSIKSNKLPLGSPTVLVSRLNPRWERCWMAYPGENAVSSTEFVPFVGNEVATEEVWAVASASSFWDQMRSRVTGTTGSHQRVSKDAIATLVVPDVRLLADDKRRQIIDLVRIVQDCRDEITDLTRTRDELLPLLMSGNVRVEDVEIPKGVA